MIFKKAELLEKLDLNKYHYTEKEDRIFVYKDGKLNFCVDLENRNVYAVKNSFEVGFTREGFCKVGIEEYLLKEQKKKEHWERLVLLDYLPKDKAEELLAERYGEKLD